MWRYGWLVPVLGISFLVPGCGKSPSNTPKPTATPDQSAAGSARSGEVSPQVVTDPSPAAGTPPTVASQPDIDLSPKPRQRQSEQQVRSARSQRQPSVRSEAPSVDTQPRVLESARLEVRSPDDSFPMEAAAPEEVAAEPARSELVSKELRFVKVYYGTNRVRTSACDDDTARWDDRSGCRPDDFYGVDAADASGPAAGSFGLDVGTLTVTFPDDHRKTKIERPFSVFGYELRDEDPSRDVVISELRSYSADYDSWLADIRGNGRRQAFIYVHGFANSFSSAARRAAQVAYDLDFDVEEEFQGLTMMFSWPSRGSVSPTAYTSDYDASDQAVEAFNHFLDLVTAPELGLQQVHIIAHSMGNRLVANALTARAIGNRDASSRIIDELVLAAPDIPATTFKTRFLRTLPAFAERVTLYVSDKDVALYASSRAREQEPRAGQLDGGLLDVDVDRFDVIDASGLDSDFLSHDYYASNNSMLSDIYSLLKRMPASERPLLQPVGPGYRFLAAGPPPTLLDHSIRWNSPTVLLAAAVVLGMLGLVMLSSGRRRRRA